MTLRTDIQTKFEERLAAFVSTLLTGTPPSYWSNDVGELVRVQKGVDDTTIQAPCVICFCNESSEAIFGRQVEKLTANVQLQSFITDGAEVHKQRVDALKKLFLMTDGATGNYRQLQAALSDEANGFSVAFVKPYPISAGVDADKWIFNITINAVAQYFSVGSS